MSGEVIILIMVKNEEAGILVTLNSLINNLNTIYIYDTGSTDNTIANINAHVLAPQIVIGHGKFIDFSTTRNAAQDWVASQLEGKKDTIVLWLDANDEIVGNLTLPPGFSSYMIEQQWHNNSSNPTNFWNRRAFVLKPTHRWQRRVHEYIQIPDQTPPKIITDFMIVQNRCQNSENSRQRWHRDIDLLLLDASDYPNCSRTMFYLARAYKDVFNMEQARSWFTKRIKCVDFPEERFWAYIYLADTIPANEKHLKVYHLLESLKVCERVEPLIILAELMIESENWAAAYTFLNRALKLKKPTDSILFLRGDDYDYKRYHLMGIVAYYVKELTIGRIALEKAIAYKNLQIDRDNMIWYTIDRGEGAPPPANAFINDR